ncbi:MAG TPA: 3-deoxy-D-manno-octulosonic acid transferase [Acidobacteriaceae bacterium]|jgi:3-deoxy-D-manno-octulosonic-acid transferase|nr:3-deoxy-D-manno-octulosonic acid transferase [Acidobacteriaceae bacterium]
MLVLYSVALLLVLAAGAPWWLFRMATSGKYREGLTERLGAIPQRIRVAVQDRRVIWIHAVSVGELLAASRLIEELEARLGHGDSENHPRLMVSTTTRTGQMLARERYGAERVFYFPLDFGFAVRAWLRALRPEMLVLMETEFWPRMLTECRKAGVPVAVVNARISDRSWPRYRRLAWIWRRLLRGLSAGLAQTELDAERLRAIGAPHVQVAGNLKYDVRTVKTAPVVDLLREYLAPDAKVLVCGSTVPGEEELLLDALPHDAVTILAPRHPERFAAVASLLQRRGARWVRRSAWMDTPVPIQPGTVVLLDSLGELASVYGLAQTAFIGGSLTASGGHNPLEAAQFGAAILMGPGYENFRGIVESLRAQQGIRIVRAAQLKNALAEVLTDRAMASAMGTRARTVFASEAGATERTVTALLDLLEARA